MKRILRFRLRHITFLAQKTYCLLYYLFFRPFYGKTHYTCYISPLAKMRTKKRTFLGKRFIIRGGASLGGRHFQCGNNFRIGYGCHLFGSIYMCDDIMVAPNVIIAGGNHGIEKSGIPMINQPGTNKGPIRIGSDVWIAANSVILSGVEIGDGAVVSAGTVVTKSVPKFSIIAGNPAKIIKYRE